MTEQTLLLVEKTKSARKKLIQALKETPARRRFCEAENPRQGLAILSKEKVDLILYHSALPNSMRDDLSALAFFKESGSCRDIPLLYVGVEGNRSLKIKALESGAWDFVEHSFKPEDLIFRTEALLRIKAGQDKLRSRIRQLERLSIVDPLTGLYNRKYLKEFLRRQVDRADRQKSQIFCMMMDIDNFKKINDEWGHPKGDLVIKEIGEILRDLLRGYDFAARYGGDEFTIILPQRMEEKDAMAVAERIRQRIAAQTFGKKGKSGVQFTVSLGVSLFPSQDVQDGDTLITAADEALYAAKRTGKNQVVLYQSRLSEGK
jgi:diguanylate cyclase (GGDEF)-like protein